MLMSSYLLTSYCSHVEMRASALGIGGVGQDISDVSHR